MSEEKFCQSCPQSNDCQRAYQMLGNAKGPSIAGKVLCAFVLPILVFAVSVGIFDRVLSGMGYGFRTAVGFFLALAVTLAAILLLRLVRTWAAGR